MSEPEIAAASRNRWLLSGVGAAVLSVAAVKLLLHLYAGRNYGYFIDELYYLACGDHLAWGYVDQPPLIALIARMARTLLGDSLPAIRFLPAVAGAAKVLLTGLIARELGGGRFAQLLAALAVLVAPGFLATDNLLSMNVFEALLWTACAYVVVRIINTRDQRLWLWFGLLAGVGLENKHSILIFGAGIAAGLLLTRERRSFRSPWIWMAGLLAFLIFLPNLVWNIQHHFPFLELQENIRQSGRNARLTPLSFLGQEVLTMLPLTLPIWLAGLWFCFVSEKGRRYRVLGWAWLFIAATILVFNPRVYYLYPAFPMLFAAGSVACESWVSRPGRRRMAHAYILIMTAAGAAVAPFAAPVLPADSYIRYAAALRFRPPAIETWKLGPLPQMYASQFGWEEMVAAIARVYDGLPPDARKETAIFCSNYGEAGAVDLFGPKYGLPKAISGHQSYFLWGPRDFNGKSAIVLHGSAEHLGRYYASVEKVANVWHKYSMPYEHFDVFYCRGLKQPVREFWPQVKSWD